MMMTNRLKEFEPSKVLEAVIFKAHDFGLEIEAFIHLASKLNATLIEEQCFYKLPRGFEIRNSRIYYNQELFEFLDQLKISPNFRNRIKFLAVRKLGDPDGSNDFLGDIDSLV